MAEETRKKFNLQTFAHTTVGRAMRELTQILTDPASADINTVTGVQVTQQVSTADAAVEDDEPAAGGQAKEQKEAGKVNKTNAGTDPAKTYLNKAFSKEWSCFG